VARRLLWFVALWAAGVLTVGAAGYAIRLVLAP
jgi:preprotein translocase subunit Sss1